MSNTELKRCPFCGGEATVRVGVYQATLVSCNDCGIVVGYHPDNKESVIKAWNRRTAEKQESGMTREDKIKALSTYCDNHECDENCIIAKKPLAERICREGGFSEMSDGILDYLCSVINAEVIPNYAQTAHLLTMEEATSSNDVWLEDISGNSGYCKCRFDDKIVVECVRHNLTWIEIDRNYNKTWRCWSFKPTEDQRIATPWAELPKPSPSKEPPSKVCNCYHVISDPPW